MRAEMRPKSYTSWPTDTATSVEALGVQLVVLERVAPMRGKSVSGVDSESAVVLLVVASYACTVPPTCGIHSARGTRASARRA